ncbi:hypothetical protein C8R48DRAFT_143651 [Suillus tomentosus]|nr:hypothetical protein C8R48DRAFT_143651 [Suillus tomentosus]
MSHSGKGLPVSTIVPIVAVACIEHHSNNDLPSDTNITRPVIVCIKRRCMYCSTWLLASPTQVCHVFVGMAAIVHLVSAVTGLLQLVTECYMVCTILVFFLM